MASKARPIPKGDHPILPNPVVSDANGAFEFYK